MFLVSVQNSRFLTLQMRFSGTCRLSKIFKWATPWQKFESCFTKMNLFQTNYFSDGSNNSNGGNGIEKKFTAPKNGERRNRDWIFFRWKWKFLFRTWQKKLRREEEEKNCQSFWSFRKRPRWRRCCRTNSFAARSGLVVLSDSWLRILDQKTGPNVEAQDLSRRWSQTKLSVSG